MKKVLLTIAALLLLSEGFTTSSYPMILFLSPVFPDQQTTAASFDLEAKIAGITTPEDIRLLVNDQVFPDFYFDSNKQLLSANIDLQEGPNTIQLTGRNASGESQSEIQLFRRVITQRSPLIRWLEPGATPSETVRSNIRIRAQIENLQPAHRIQVLHNDRSISNFFLDPSTYLLEAPIDLVPGANRVHIMVEQPNGYSQKTLDIYRRIPQPTQIRWQQPARRFTTTDAVQVPILANIWPLTPDHLVELFINGQQRYDYALNYRTGQLERTMLLLPGQNHLQIVVTGPAGRLERSVHIERLPPPPPTRPLVQIEGISDGYCSPQPQLDLYATISGVPSTRGILLMVNGGRHEHFQYNPQNGHLRTTLFLQPGPNTVRLIARNLGGIHQQVIQVSYREPQLPAIAFLSPTPEGRVTDRVITIRAKVRHVQSRQDIRWIVNGQPYSGFTHRPDRSVVRADLRLKPGKNRIRIIARNPDGETVARRVVIWTRKPIDPVEGKPGGHRQRQNSDNKSKDSERSNTGVVIQKVRKMSK